MPGSQAGRDVLTVERAEVVTRDMETITELVSRMYIEHRARSRRIPEAGLDASVQGAVAGVLRAGIIRLGGVEYEADGADPGGHPMGAVTIEGRGDMTTGRLQHRFTRGGVFMTLPDRPYAAGIRDGFAMLLQIPLSVAAGIAEAHTGLPATQLRFEYMGPVSRTAGAAWARTVTFGCQQLIESRITEISPLIADELTRLTAITMLETFPNTTMTLGYVRGPGWVPPTAVGRAAAFIEANPERPITLDDIAAAARVTGRALQYAFRRHYDTTPTGYLRRVRLQRAHDELRSADAGEGVTVTATARKWGWANPAHFSSAYRRQFGQLPGQTLRSQILRSGQTLPT